MAVIHGPEQTGSQQFGELPRVGLVRFLAFTQQFVAPRIAHDGFAHIPAHDVVHPSACVVSSNVICSGPLKLFTNRMIAAASVATIVSITTLPSASRTATTVVAWCRSHPIYLSNFIERPLLCSTCPR